MQEIDLYKTVAAKLNIDVQKVIEYDKLQWTNVKLDLNNPTFDILEIPFLGSFTMTRPKLISTLKFSLRILKRMRNKMRRNEKQNKPNSAKLIRDMESQKKYFSNLWKLKQQIYGTTR